LFLVAGHTADRVPRLRILRICYAGFSLCSLLLLLFTLHGLSSALPIYAILLLNGTVRAFNGPASQAFIPLLVPKKNFPNAIAWSSSIFQTSTIAGPMIGGVLYGLTGSPVWVYTSAALAYFGAFLFLGRVKIAAAERSHSAASLGVVLEGLQYIWRNKLILGAMSLDLFAVLLGGAVALLPVYAREILKVGATGLGALRRRAGATMLWCVFAFGVFTVIFGVSRNFALSLGVLFLLGASDTISVIVRHTMIQLGTPDEMRGRVSAVNMVFIGASNEVGQFESGITAQWFGTVPAVVLGGLGTMLIVLLWSWWFPSLRQLDELVPQDTVPVVAESSATDATAIAE